MQNEFIYWSGCNKKRGAGLLITTSGSDLTKTLGVLGTLLTMLLIKHADVVQSEVPKLFCLVSPFIKYKCIFDIGR